MCATRKREGRAAHRRWRRCQDIERKDMTMTMDFVFSEANALLASPLLRRIAPLTLSGYARFRAIIDRDGALPARVKALFVATAATTKGYRSMALRELERGRQLGLAFEEASAAAIVLSSVRGEGASLSFIDALEAVYPASTGR